MTGRRLQIRLRLLEELVDPALLGELEIAPTEVPAQILAFLRDGVARMNADPDMSVAAVAPDLIPLGGLGEVEVILCSRSAMRGLFEQPGHVLGVHLVSTPDVDPFGEEAPQARAFRVAIPFEAGWVLDRVRDAVTSPDGTVDETDLVHGVMGWLDTLPHEVHPVLWFAGNGSFNSPADLDAMEGEIGHDLFDITTGYGIRPALIEGEEVEPEDAGDAALLMEEMVEERGRLMAERVFRDDLGPERFLTLLSDVTREKDKRDEIRMEMTP